MFEEDIENIEKAKREYQEASEKAAKAAKNAIKRFLEAFPEVKRLRWTQYTPYFNDGEPCVFSVHEIELDLGFKNKYGEEWLDTYGIGSNSRDFFGRPNLVKGVIALNALFKASEDGLKQAFGDHAEITVDRETMTVEECEHE